MSRVMSSPVARYAWLAATLLLLVLLPLTDSATLINVATKCLIAGLFAMGFNLLWGQMGLLSFGHAAYLGIGTFATLHMMNAIDEGWGLPAPLLPVLAGALGVVVGALMGWFASRRTGIYFAMITLAVAELTHVIADKWQGFFGGEAGVRSIRTDWWLFGFQDATSVYYYCLVWSVLLVIALWALLRSPFGLLMYALRENEERVRFLGYRTHSIKVVGFAVSAGVSAVAGSLMAFMNESANASMFATLTSAEVVLNTVIGGSAVFLGPALGAAFNTLFGYYIGGLSHFWLLYQGLIFVLVIMYAPGGLGGLFSGATRQAREGRLAHHAPAYAVGALASLLIAVATITVVELVGTVMGSSYRVLRLTSGETWPPVSLWGIDWHPLGIGTFTFVLVLIGAGTVLLRWAMASHRQALDRIGSET